VGTASGSRYFQALTQSIRLKFPRGMARPEAAHIWLPRMYALALHGEGVGSPGVLHLVPDGKLHLALTTQEE